MKKIAPQVRARSRAERNKYLNEIRFRDKLPEVMPPDSPITAMHDGYLSTIRKAVTPVDMVEGRRLSNFIRLRGFGNGGDDLFPHLVNVVNEPLHELPEAGYSSQHVIERANRAELIRYLNRFIQAYRADNEDAAEAWLNALMLGLKSDRRFIPKARAKLKSENALTPEVRAAGTQAGKDKGAARRAELHKAINDYLNYPAALAKGNAACLRFLVERKLTYGYAEATILDPHIKQLFAAKRKAMKAEN
jgi:hypothetical protein